MELKDHRNANRGRLADVAVSQAAPREYAKNPNAELDRLSGLNSMVPINADPNRHKGDQPPRDRAPPRPRR